MLIDTHCHLNDRHAFPLPEVAVEEAVGEGVERLVVVGIDTESSRYAVELAERFEQVYAVVGWHPNHATEYQRSELAGIEEMLDHPKVIALGEIGLDYYRDYASKADQMECLSDQLDLAVKRNVPIVFHCRDAYEDLLDILESRPPHKYLFHCWAGSQEHANRAIALDCWFGVDGPLTYKSADQLKDVVRTLPKEKILIETDAPWMTPVPFRGQKNKPAWVKFVNQALAETLGCTEEDCALMTSDNARNFYSKLA